MKVMLFAAGLGTRLKPLTDTMPKALVTIGGIPLIEITLRNLIKSGASEVVVNVHHFAMQVVEFLKGRDWGIPVLISDESTKLLDTGGGLRKAAGLFTNNDEPILLHNVDILSNADLRVFYEKSKSCEISLMVSTRETQRYLLFDNEMNLSGWTNISTGELKSPYNDIKVEQLHKYAFSGIHCVSPKIFSYMDSFPEKFPIMDFYLKICSKLQVKGYLKHDLDLLDVGKIGSLQAAEEFVVRYGL